MSVRRQGTAVALALAALSGCDLAPSYRPPSMILPASYQGAGFWQVAHPSDRIPRGAWWLAFGNPNLDAIEARLPQNPDLQAAYERFEQARDLAAEAEAGLYPQISGGFSPSANRESAQHLFRSPNSTAPLQANDISLAANASWQIDLWDRIGNAAKAGRERAQAASADLASVELSLRAQLADTYLTLRGLDQELALYAQTISYYRTGVNITTLRLQHQIGNLLDVERAQNQLSAAEALYTDTLAQRALATHAIADLIGVPASGFTMPDQAETPLVLPEIPTGVPAALLQRRPDIAAAERNMAAANAEIGVARAAFFPNITLSGALGREAGSIDLFEGPLTMWSIGAAVVEPLFEGGLRRAELRYATSSYAQTRDLYRATVLAAIQQVEDQLSLTRLLATESRQTRDALAAASKTQSLALELYQQGADDYLNVVVAQVAALQAGVNQVGVFIRAQQASINLTLALGGGWSRTDLPLAREIVPFNPLLP